MVTGAKILTVAVRTYAIQQQKGSGDDDTEHHSRAWALSGRLRESCCRRRCPADFP